MPFHASTDELRLALLSLFSAAPVLLGDRRECARIIDASIETAVGASRDVAQVPAGNLTTTRFGAARVLNSLCAACRACPRGLGYATPPIKLPPPRRAA